MNEIAGANSSCDDSPTARKQVSDTLSQLGIEIIPARNGLEALEMLKGWADQAKMSKKNYGDHRCRNPSNGWLPFNPRNSQRQPNEELIHRAYITQW